MSAHLTAQNFSLENVAKRREEEPNFRKFPSLYTTLSSNAADALDRFFAENAPQEHYPYVWVRCALEPLRHRAGIPAKCAWVYEVMVSYDFADIPKIAPIIWINGVKQPKSGATQTLFSGTVERFDQRGRDMMAVYFSASIGAEHSHLMADKSHDVEPEEQAGQHCT